MMMNQIKQIKERLEKLSARERIYVFIGGFAIIYLLYFILFFHSLSNKKKELGENIAGLQNKIIGQKQQIATIREVTKSPVFLQLQNTQKRLQEQVARLHQQLVDLKPTLFLASDLPVFTKRMLDLPRGNGLLISLQQFPIEVWPPEDAAKIVNQNLASIPHAFQQKMQLEFQNDYFGTINYLSNFEKLSANLYWDSMSYKVINYPRADVTIQFHLLSLQKS